MEKINRMKYVCVLLLMLTAWMPSAYADTDAVAVDLGLPSGTKWANMNVGATKPEEYGSYFAWGETDEKDFYDWSSYIHCDGSEETIHDIGSDIAGTQFDVAHVQWGGSWKMPTWEQVTELLDRCTSEWATVNNVNGRKFTGPNGNSIFLPAAGLFCDSEQLVYADLKGFYWSSTSDGPGGARYHDFDPNYAFRDDGLFCDRYYGFAVRPVLADDEVETSVDYAQYEAALEAIPSGAQFRIFTLSNGSTEGSKKYYLNEDGFLTNSKTEAHLFTFGRAEGSGLFVSPGWILDIPFSNPHLTEGATGDLPLHGHIRTDYDNGLRNDWEGQVWYKRGDHYAVRSTNAVSTEWGANTYWTVLDSDADGFPEADYSLTPNFVWQLEAIPDFGEPYVVWCEGNTTLYFITSRTALQRGDTYKGQTITDVWCGEDVTDSYQNEKPYQFAPPKWGWSTSECTRVVFDKSFENVRVKSTSKWFGSKVESIEGIEYLNTSEVTSMSYMFAGLKMSDIDLSHLDTHNVKYMNSMFQQCDNLTSLDLSHFDTGNVVSMCCMFRSCPSLTTLDLSHFDTSNVTNLQDMFRDCSSLTTLNLSHFDTKNVTTMQQMCWGCTNLRTIYAGKGWSTENVTTDTGWGMFNNCTSLVGGAGTVYDTYHVDYTYAHIDGGSSNPGYFTDKEILEAEKDILLMRIYECMTSLADIYDVLKEKASRDEAPDLYAWAQEIGIRLDYAQYVLKTITTMEEVRDMIALVTDIMDQLGELSEQIEAFEVVAIPEKAIDLGLPSGTKWAPWNVGASKPEDYGGYYAWGETEEKEIYYSETYTDLGLDIAGTDYDVAHVKWGGLWTMPTRNQMEELRVNCTSEWTTVNGIEGLKFTGPNGNNIFMPAAGMRQYDGISDVNKGCYWSSSNGDQHYYRTELMFNPTESKIMWCVHYLGLTVRPVIANNIPTDISTMTDNSATIVGIYNLNGQQQETLQSGMNIVRMSNGTTRKILVK